MASPPLVQFHSLKGSSYQDLWDFQKTLQSHIVQNKRKNKGKVPVNHAKAQVGHIIFAEHSPVYTLGKSGSLTHLLKSEDELTAEGVEFHKINRGGDITFHGPGQITGYLILDLDDYYHDLHRFVREIEEAIILFLAEFGLEGKRIEGYTGVWLGKEGSFRKICAIGIHISRWVSLHGFALNIDTDLEYFNGIIPCGIEEDEKSVTNLRNELGSVIDVSDVEDLLKSAFKKVFKFDWVN